MGTVENIFEPGDLLYCIGPSFTAWKVGEAKGMDGILRTTLLDIYFFTDEIEETNLDRQIPKTLIYLGEHFRYDKSSYVSLLILGEKWWVDSEDLRFFRKVLAT